VIVYNTDELSEDEVPDSVFELTDPKWKGKVGLPPTNASFQAFVTAMRLDVGDGRTREWLEDLKGNDPKFYEKNTPVVEAVASGEIHLGLVNHYYLYLVREEQPDAPIANKYLPGEDPGALVSVAGVGILESADHGEAAERFVEFLLADEQQRFYTDEAEEAEIPLVEGIAPKEGVPTLDELANAGPDIDLSSLGKELEQTLELLNETGYTS
jgi:iron(III) transport system substrate-binding protein